MPPIKGWTKRVDTNTREQWVNDNYDATVTVLTERGSDKWRTTITGPSAKAPFNTNTYPTKEVAKQRAIDWMKQNPRG